MVLDLDVPLFVPPLPFLLDDEARDVVKGARMVFGRRVLDTNKERASETAVAFDTKSRDVEYAEQVVHAVA